MPSYDPEIIERFALRLERKAVAVRRGFIVGGGLFGALVGAVPLTPLHVAWPVPQVFGFATLLVGAAVFALIGFVVGDNRAELLRLHAQTMLATLHAQRTSLAVWRLLGERQDEMPAPVLVSVPEPEPEPIPEPAAPILTPVPPAPAVAVQLATVPSALRPAGVSAPPVTPPPVTG